MQLDKSSKRQKAHLILLATLVLKSVCGQHSENEKVKSRSSISSRKFQAVTKRPPQDYSAELKPIAEEAKKRGLPMSFFNELIARDSWILVRPATEGAQYRRGLISGGTIYVPSAGKPMAEWNSADFQVFYNELFHAWWDQVFMRDDKYQGERDKLLKNKELENKYKLAHPREPHRAQEEAYSETVATLMVYAYGTVSRDPQTGEFKRVPPNLSQLYYNTKKTVSPVSHSDVEGFTPEAESTYPNQEEYSWLFEKLFGQKPPIPPTQ